MDMFSLMRISLVCLGCGLMDFCRETSALKFPCSSLHNGLGILPEKRSLLLLIYPPCMKHKFELLYRYLYTDVATSKHKRKLRAVHWIRTSSEPLWYQRSSSGAVFFELAYTSPYRCKRKIKSHTILFIVSTLSRAIVCRQLITYSNNGAIKRLGK